MDGWFALDPPLIDNGVILLVVRRSEVGRGAAGQETIWRAEIQDGDDHFVAVCVQAPDGDPSMARSDGLDAFLHLAEGHWQALLSALKLELHALLDG